MRLQETQGPEACVSVYDQDAHCPNPAAARVLENATYSVCSNLQPCAVTADLRSPADVFHPEAYLIGALVRLYGWRVVEPGVLRRSWRGSEVAAAREVA